MEKLDELLGITGAVASTPSPTVPAIPRPQTTDEDDDSALIWDADGGQNELAKRRQRRQNAATKRAPVTPS